jgi:hypothetical protein
VTTSGLWVGCTAMAKVSASSPATPSLTIADLNAAPARPKFSAEPDTRSLTVQETPKPDVRENSVVVVQVAGSGSGGGSGASSYHQVSPAATWTIQHNQGTRPQFMLFVDSDPDEPVFTDILYPDLNTAVIEWTQPETGWAFY